MPPQTILAATNGGSSTNAASEGANSSTSARTASTNNNNHNTSNNANTAKLKHQLPQQPKSCHTATPRTVAVPTLQWPWHATVSTGVAAASTPGANSIAGQNKKRNALTTPSDGAAKKSRPESERTQNSSSLPTTGIYSNNTSKRLKAAALEESQTKITGYFKSQMKAQIHQNGGSVAAAGKRALDTLTSAAAASGNSLTMSTPATTASLNKYFNILSQLKEHNNAAREPPLKPAATPAIAASAPKSVAINSISAAVAPPQTANLTITAAAASAVAAAPSTMPVPALKKIERSKPTKIAQVAPNLRKTPSHNSGSYSASLTGKSPAKKHVAIAPRTPEMKQQQLQQAASKAAEAAKQHTPQSQTVGTATQPPPQLAPNQPAMLLTAIRLPQQAASSTQSPSTVSGSQLKASPVMASKLSTVTAANAGAAGPNATTLYQLPVQLPNLVQLPQLLAANGANIMQLNNVAAAVAKTAAAAASSTAATSAQAAQAAAAQYFLNGTVFKLQQFTTATTTTATSAVATGPATVSNPFNLMSANDLQDMLLKQQQQQQQMQLQQQQQQQKAANAAVAASTANAATSFQEIFQQQIAAAIAANQQQQQQQQQQQFQQLQRLGAAAAAAASMQQQPVFMATPAGLILNAASLPAMLAQAAAALVVNNSQQQQQQQQKAVAAALHSQPQQLPALQPIQPNPLPALSSIFAGSSQQQHEQHEQLQQQQFQQQQQQLVAQLAMAQQQQQQFITATQPPPLSAVTVNNNSNNTASSSHNANVTNVTATTTTTTTSSHTTPTAAPAAKLAIVKATSAPSAAYAARGSQPPPLVTISSNATKARPQLSAATSSCMQVKAKPSALAKPYQKRAPKTASSQPQPPKPIAAASPKAKLTPAGGKFTAMPTTPPPLVPAIVGAAKELGSSLRGLTAGVGKASSVSSVLPTPALVSIAPAPPPTSTKPAQSVATAACNTTASAAASISMLTAAATKTMSQTEKCVPAAAIIPTVAPMASASTDLFDLVKNSNGAISIATTATATGNTCTSVSSAAPSFIKIKDEPLDELCSNINMANKTASSTSFSAHLLAADIKSELLEDTTKMCAISSTTTPTSISNQSSMHHDYSSSSCCFSSLSNSVSSAADLSLEASTPASLSSSSNSCSSAPSPAPSTSLLTSVTSPRNSPPADSNCNSNSASSVSASRASSQDMLSELVTSSCISSGASSNSDEVSLSKRSNNNSSVKPTMDDANMAQKDTEAELEVEVDKRDLPTPESGIGGSLSNSESSNSVASAISNISVKSTSSLLHTILAPSSPSPDNTSLASNVPSPASPADDSNPQTSAVPSPAGRTSYSSSASSTSSSSSSNLSKSSTSTPIATTIDTQLAEENSKTLPNCAISPILSQPKTIRFPAASGGYRHGPKGAKRHDGVCHWDKCNKKHDSSSKLLDHMQSHHVNTQTGPFACLWVGCKVYNKESCSRRWLERHVLSHGGSKQFKCIVEGCGLRFGSQLALQKHVNNHFTATEAKEGTNKRTSDPPVPKQLRKNGKKLRYRRQPFSARMFDFFDAGIMEGLQHRLRQISALTNGLNAITFQGHSLMRRRNLVGAPECFVRWSPREIISDEWLPESNEPYVKTVHISRMRPAEKTKVESLLMTSYKLPYVMQLSGSDFNCWNPDAATVNETADEEDNNATDSDETDDEDDDANTDEKGANENDATNELVDMVQVEATETITTGDSYQYMHTIAKLHLQQGRRKHSRKPQRRMPQMC